MDRNFKKKYLGYKKITLELNKKILLITLVQLLNISINTHEIH